MFIFVSMIRDLRNLYTVTKNGIVVAYRVNYSKLYDYIVEKELRINGEETVRGKISLKKIIDNTPVEKPIKFRNEKNELYRVQQMKRSKR